MSSRHSGDDYTKGRDDALSKIIPILFIAMMAMPIMLAVKLLAQDDTHAIQAQTSPEDDEIVVVAKEAFKSTDGNKLGNVNDAEGLKNAADRYYLAFLDKDDPTQNNYQMRNFVPFRHGTLDDYDNPPDSIKGVQPCVMFESPVSKDVYDRYEIGDTLDGKTYEDVTGKQLDASERNVSDEWVKEQLKANAPRIATCVVYTIVAMVVAGNINRRNIAVGFVVTLLAFAGEFALVIV